MIPEQARERRLVAVEGLRYAYPTGLLAVDQLNFSVGVGEIVAIVGPSGCGKSTLLSLLAGMKQSLAGTITWSAESLASEIGSPKRPAKRKLSLVFQRDTVLPWRTVEENVALGLNYVAISKHERRERIASLLRLVRMEEFSKAYPNQLSGGMRRRVALLTGVAPFPHLLMLDEPFAALDEPTRVNVHADLLEIIYRFGLSVILVTHDLAEAITLADRVIILTRRPARVARVIETTFGHDRDIRALRELPAYQTLYAETWRELWKQTESSAP